MARLLAFLALLLAGASPSAAGPPLVLAAASLQESLSAAADAWAAKGHSRPVLSFAASSALARQIDAGAPADLFLSADEPWMDDVVAHGKTRPGSRAALLSNRLVLVAPAGPPRRIAIAAGFPLAGALGPGARLAIADPDAVPAGRYGREALVRLGVWPSVADRLARADSVRAALALVERGAAPLGIVYLTDARASARVQVAGIFPEASHAPITYPLALLAAGRSEEAAPFRAFLLSAEGKAIFRRFGFGTR